MTGPAGDQAGLVRTDLDEWVDPHGTPIGVGRHHQASEPPCAVCQFWIDELIADGLLVVHHEGTEQHGIHER